MSVVAVGCATISSSPSSACGGQLRRLRGAGRTSLARRRARMYLDEAPVNVIDAIAGANQPLSMVSVRVPEPLA